MFWRFVDTVILPYSEALCSCLGSSWVPLMRFRIAQLYFEGIAWFIGTIFDICLWRVLGTGIAIQLDVLIIV